MGSLLDENIEKWEAAQVETRSAVKLERKAMPPSHCDYLMRMHMKSMEAISRYMAGGCGTGALHGPLMVQVELRNLRRVIDQSIQDYGDGS